MCCRIIYRQDRGRRRRRTHLQEHAMARPFRSQSRNPPRSPPPSQRQQKRRTPPSLHPSHAFAPQSRLWLRRRDLWLSRQPTNGLPQLSRPTHLLRSEQAESGHVVCFTLDQLLQVSHDAEARIHAFRRVHRHGRIGKTPGLAQPDQSRLEQNREALEGDVQ